MVTLSEPSASVSNNIKISDKPNSANKTIKNEKFAELIGEPVFVNVYNLHWQNGMKIGAYHTGTVVYGKEYGYGGHPFPTSGIFEIEPRNTEELGEGFSFKEALFIGRTYLSKEGVERLLVSLTDEYPGDAYHLLHLNCNHFTAHLIGLLCNGVLPKWVNLLATFAANVPFIESVLPAHWVRPSLMYESEFDVEEEVAVNSVTDARSSTSTTTPVADGGALGITSNSIHARFIHSSTNHAPSLPSSLPNHSSSKPTNSRYSSENGN
ncbi:unnamed protein product [Calicophoron daubneyi]|uniref:PPPDE domain-containing protein n=1 Tax=Calicophoron daubneyi TaxID=300641 RepID=A0AAV2TPB2_CALDB